MSYSDYLETMDADDRARAVAENRARAERRRRWARAAKIALAAALALAAIAGTCYAYLWLAERVIP